ncbi:glycerol-3-phosphate acyltransferase [Virgibacillus oceani]|uniref:Glycerol-3-phosphate acyltransferase n=1 Tax=Virgibacillus oceani TaxID=1479511 RepID=A0A917HLX2_9BACI|nr:glycerol-3-phosphate acyltransferase [Virgibacillus oceani]GGG83438.1 acyl-phosphate glycerol 3-phosphate acyltransferase [Virgibacillus oceani]
MKPLLEIIILCISYLFGCLNGAYYVGKIVSKKDIRQLGSTNAGARNAGRVFGRSAFVYTVIIDALKTAVPLTIVFYFFDTSLLVLGGIALAVLAGHIWPAQLNFRGGKGVVVYLAAALVLAPITLVIVGLTVLIGLKVKRNFTIIGLIGLSTIPVTLLILSKFILAGIFLVMLSIVILVHRNGD